MSKQIESETKVILNLLVGVLKFPFIFILALFGKRKYSEAFEPIKQFFYALLQPKFTVTIILILITMFLASMFFSTTFIQYLLLYPYDFMSLRIYSLFTHGFLHANISHLLGNILFIYIFGRIVETRYGAKRTAIIYFFGLVFAAFFASIMNIVNNVTYPSLGASGAAMSLVAVAILVRPFSITYMSLIPLPVFFLGWLAILSDITGIINSSGDGIGYYAHIGGALSVFLLFNMFFKFEDKQELMKGLLLNLLLLLALILFMLVF